MSDANTSLYRHFHPEEFLLCDPPCFIEQMDHEFLTALDNAREIAGFPFVLNSAYRSRDYEIQKKGRSGTSSHCKGLAVDISCLTGPYRIRMVRALLSAGFTRLGIGKTFIHVDMDPDKVPSIWLY